MKSENVEDRPVTRPQEPVAPRDHQPAAAPASPAKSTNHAPPPPPRLAPAAPRKGNLLVGIIVGLLIVAACGAGVYYLYTHYIQKTTATDSKARAGGRPTPVVAAKVRRGDFDVIVRGLGSVTAFNMVTVRTRVDGELVNVAFKEGDTVHAGDLLAEIDSKPFEVQRDQAAGQKARDQASLDNAKVDLKRYTDAGPEVVPQQQIDTAEASVRNFEGAIKVDDAAIHAAQVQIDYCRITAPITGRVGLRLVDQGNQVHASDPAGLVVITQLQPIAVNFTIAEDSLPEVLAALKDNPRLGLDAYSRDRSTKIASGELLAVDNQIDPTTGTVRIKAQFKNEDNSLFPNQFVNVRMLVKTLPEVVLVDTAGVQRGPQGTFVYLAQKDESTSAPGTEPAAAPAPEAAPAASAPASQGRGGRPQETYTVHMRPVTTADEDGSKTIITAGLDAGDIVVTTGVDKLIDGSKVTIRYADRPATQPATSSQPATGAAPASRRGGRGRAGSTPPATREGSAPDRGESP